MRTRRTPQGHESRGGLLQSARAHTHRRRVQLSASAAGADCRVLYTIDPFCSVCHVPSLQRVL